jgi:hypothetical protein
MALLNKDRDPDEDDRLDGSDDNEAFAFDSGLQLGLGIWRTPGLPRLRVSGEFNPGTYSIDSANYRPEAEAWALVVETRLFFPLMASLGWPLGLSVLTQNTLTEVPSLPFTTSGAKSPVRPKHSLGLNIGLRADFLFLGMQSESSLELAAQHYVYLGANLTAIGPLARFRIATETIFDVWPKSGIRPVLAFEGYGAPYLSVAGFDSRLTTESSGEVRTFVDVVKFSKQSSAWGFGVQAEGGVTWPRSQRGRQQTLLLVWSYQATQFNKVLSRTTQAEAGESGTVSRRQLNARGALNSIALGFRSSFL